MRLGTKRLVQFFRYSASASKDVLFIVGCQRSGTTMVTRIFERDPAARVYPEVSQLSSRDLPKHLRLNPLDEVKSEIDRCHAQLVVLKPLVESQNTAELLEYFNGSAVWMYRSYEAVIDSIIRMWGPDHSARDLASIAENRDDWRTEKIPQSARDLVLEFYEPDMDPHIAGALFWYARNSIAVSENLNTNPEVVFCRYEELLENPELEIGRIYGTMGRHFPGTSLVSDVEPRSRPQNDVERLPTELKNQCDALLETLDGFRGK